MSTWEDRMAARAQKRIRAEQERERARGEAEWAAEMAERAAQVEALRPAEPPGGCAQCWDWADGWPCPWWIHGESVQPGPGPEGYPLARRDNPDGDWCWHACHGDETPVFCGPIGIAAAG